MPITAFFLRPLDPNLLRLFSFLSVYKGRLAVTAVLLLITASTSSATAAILGKISDLGFYQQQPWVVIAGPLALLAVSLASAASSVGSSMLMAEVSQDVLVTLRTRLFRLMLHWPASAYQNLSTGQISAKFVNEANMALSGATQALMVLLRDSVQCLALLAVLFWHNWQLTLVTFVLAPGLVIVLRTLSRRMRLVVKSSQDNLADMISHVEESYGGERLVKISGAFAEANAAFAVINEKSRRLALSTLKIQNLGTPLTQMLTMAAIAVVVAAALWEAQQGWLTFGDFITFMTAMLLLRDPIQKLSGLNGTFAAIAVSARSIFAALDTASEADQGQIVLSEPIESLSFEHAGLTYPGTDNPALTDISFTLHRGEEIALVGPSGSGKSSAANLAARFWEPTVGRLLVNGRPMTDYTLQSLRSQIAFVSQDIVLLDDTLRANLTYGIDHASDEQIAQAIEDAALSDFTASLPEGLDTRIGEEGRLLSGGQRQRLSIARAFLKNASLLILDEPTSALDSEAEQQIREALKRLTKSRGALVIAHRLSSIADADRIIVLSQGRIIETGSWQQLSGKNGLFARLCRLQGLSASREVADHE